MADEVSKTGVYIDMKTGKVTNSPPEEGIQLVGPGGVIDAAAQAQIDGAKAAASGAPSEPKTVTTPTAAPEKRGRGQAG